MNQSKRSMRDATANAAEQAANSGHLASFIETIEGLIETENLKGGN